MLDIGQKVSWKIGVFNMVGCVLEDLQNGKISVMTHTRNGIPHYQQTKVDKELLTKIN